MKKSRLLKTRLTELLGVDYPIQCGTMQWLSRAELVAAVANAGGFACLAAATFPAKGQLAGEIRKTRDLTDRPFGVNVSLFPSLHPQAIESMIQVVIDEGVGVIETAGRNPEPYRQQITDAGLIHIHKCARLKDATKMDRIGVDAIAVVGTESGGHPGMAGVSSMVQIPLAADSVSAPLIAGGGICDGRSLAAALALGADGVVMGTRFLLTRECIAHPKVKQRLMCAETTDTVMMLESLNNPGRMLKNRRVETVLDMERQGSLFEEIAPVISGEISCRGWLEGKVDDGLFSCGQVIGRISDILSVAELMEKIVEDVRAASGRLEAITGRCHEMSIGISSEV